PRVSHETVSIKQTATKAVTAINDLNNARPQAGTVPRRIAYAAPLVRLAMLTTYKVLRRNDTTRNFFLALRVAILINAALSVSLNEAACIATKHTSNTINATLNGSIVHSVNRLSANSTRPLRAHNRFAARQCNTRTSRRVYKVIRITPRGVSR